jgi:hypothetical protein
LSSSPCAQEQVAAAQLRNGDFWYFNVKPKSAAGADTSGGIIPTGTYILRYSSNRLQAYRLVGNEEQLLENSMGLFSLIGRQPRAPQNGRLTASSRDSISRLLWARPGNTHTNFKSQRGPGTGMLRFEFWGWSMLRWPLATLWHIRAKSTSRAKIEKSGKRK